MVRGTRIALNKPARRDGRGHSLPSDRSMHYVELQLECKPCPEGERPILGAWFIESYLEKFDPAQVNERRNAAVTTQHPDDSGRQRYSMRCPKCSNAPVLRQETIDRWLAKVYEQGAVAKVVRIPV